MPYALELPPMVHSDIPTLPVECFGFFVTTPGVDALLSPETIKLLIDKHMTNRWGDIDKGDAMANEAVVRSVASGFDGFHGRIMSVYNLPLQGNQKVWVITYPQSDPKLQQDADHCNTCVMLPTEY